MFLLCAKHEMIMFYRCARSEACTGKDVCDRSNETKKIIRKWIKASRECPTSQHFFQGLAEMRLKNRYASICVGHDTNFKPLVVRKTKDAKLNGRMSNIGLDCRTFREPLGLRVREQHGIGPHKVVLEKQLVSPSNLHQIPTKIIITSH